MYIVNNCISYRVEIDCLDDSKPSIYYHIAGEEQRCFIEVGNVSAYVCYFGKWALILLDTSLNLPYYDIIDQLYCSNNDSYTDSCTSSLYIIYIPIINVVYGSFCN